MKKTSKKGKGYDQSVGVRKIARDAFMDCDMRTRTSGNKKAYKRKDKHKKSQEDY